MKKFLNARNAGFTLVELVIVIAILAILAGVGIPVYSGYIKKAEASADNQILAAVKTAVDASMATVSSYDKIEVTEGAANVFVVKAFNGTTEYDLSANNVEDAVKAPYQADFDLFMEGNTAINFKQDGKTKATWQASTSKWTFSAS